MVSRVIAGFVALVLAAFGAFVVTQAVETADQRALEKLSDTSAYVAIEPIPVGTQGDALAEYVEVRQMPSGFLPEGAVGDLGSIADLVAGATILKGEVLLAERFISQSALDPTATLKVPSGLDEFSITFLREDVLGGAIRAGDYVSLYSTIDILDANGVAVGSETELIGSGLLVTSINGPFTTTSETGEVSLPEDSVIVTVATSRTMISEIINSDHLGVVSISRSKNGSAK